MMRFAVISGLWYGSEITPVPNRIDRVRSAATAMNSSGELIVSHPAEWCSPIQASWKPRRSSHCISSRSRSMQAAGFSSIGWNGGRKMPWRRWILDMTCLWDAFLDCARPALPPQAGRRAAVTQVEPRSLHPPDHQPGLVLSGSKFGSIIFRSETEQVSVTADRRAYAG